MKKILSILLCLIIVSLCSCNTPTDNSNTDASSDIITDGSEASEKASENTNQNEAPPITYGISIDSLDELSQMREIFYCTDKEKVESTLLHWGCYPAEELLPFLDVVDSVPYIDIIDGEITWVAYSESDIYSNKVLNVTKTAENGDWVRISYFLQIPDGKDPMSWVTERESRKDAVILEPIESQDKRVSLISESRYKHPVYEGDCVEWGGTVDEIAVEILYYSTKVDDIKLEEVLNSLTITSIEKKDPIDPTLTEQISEGMTYREVKELLGHMGVDVGSDDIVFEYRLTDGKVAHIYFKANGASELSDFVVEKVTIE